MKIKNRISIIFSRDNDFFHLTENAKYLPHIAFSSLPLPLLFIMISAVIVQFILAPVFFGDIDNVKGFTGEVFLLFTVAPLTVVFIALWVKYVERRKFFTIGFTNRNFISKYAEGFGTGTIMISAVVGLMALTGVVEIEENSSLPLGIANPGAVIILLFGYIFQGGSEEVLARGWQFQVIGARYKPWHGVVISSMLFGLLHGLNKGVTVLAIINLSLFSVLMVLFVLKDGNIWSACGFHSAWNWVQGNVYGLNVSGNVTTGGTIIDLQAAGPDILTGGIFGPEGSLLTTSVMLVGITAVFCYSKIKELEKNCL